MSELGQVLYSSGLSDVEEDTAAPVLDICPRTYLQLSCIKDQYECLCETIEAYETSIQRGVKGEPVSVTLVMKVPARGMDSAQGVIAGVQLTGLIADIAASRHEVRATFSLSKNHNLRAHVLNNGL